MRPAAALVRAVAVVFLATACERGKAPAPASSPPSAAPTYSPATAAGVVPPRPWDDEVGPLIATPDLDGGAVIMFSRDTTNAADVGIELFSHDDHTSQATLHPGSAVRSCAWERHASLTPAEGAAAPNGWSLALAPGVATPFGIDGVSDLSPRDSAALVVRINRLVSAIPEDSASTPFRGLPIVVRDAWRFQLADSTIVAVAIAMRSLNVESNPRAQATAIIAEPDPASGPEQWRTAFSERIAGPEDRIEGMDLLAAFRIHGTQPALALVREGDGGLQVEIVERTAPGVWRVRWSNSALPCAKL